MLYDARRATAAGDTIKADICIVGSGAAGLSMAHSLINATAKSGRRLKVVVLESSHHNEKLEPKPDQHHRYEDRAVQIIYVGELDPPAWDVPAEFFLRSRIRCFGGTTNCWEGWTQPLTDVDFDRSDVNPLFKWPIGLKDLEPYYQRAMDYCSIGTWPVSSYDDPGYWIKEAKQWGQNDIALLPLGGEAQALRTRAVIRIAGTDDNYEDPIPNGGWNFQHVWGRCIRVDPSIALYRNANVRMIEVEDPRKLPRKVKRLQVTTLVGRSIAHSFYVEAGHYVLATGCVENTRLLLHSKDVAAVAGNALGYYLMTHPLIERAATFEMNADLPKAIRLFYGYDLKIARTDLAPHVFAVLVPILSALNRINFRAWVSFPEGKGSKGSVNFCCEQFPSRNRYVRLSATGTDGVFDDPLPVVSMTPTDDELGEMEDALRFVGRVLQDPANGYVRNYDLVEMPRMTLTGEHAMGTTRMSADPKDGVVNSDCRLHNVENLYVAGGSVFPTGGWANPTLTIIALALRLSDHLKERLN